MNRLNYRNLTKQKYSKTEKAEIGIASFLFFISMGTNSLISSLFLIAAGILLLPLGPLRALLLKLKNTTFIINSLAIGLVIIGLCLSPTVQQTKVILPNNVQSIISNIN